MPTSDLVCFSHLRWDHVYQRPNHLMARASRDRRVWFIEEPDWEPGAARLERDEITGDLTVIRPVVTPDIDRETLVALLNGLVRGLYEDEGIDCPVAWYYAPMSIEWTESLPAAAVVYDCMDELTAFRGAPRRLAENEARLLARADVVFTGGHSLYEAKRSRHPNVHAFPSAVDAAHFADARQGAAAAERPEQAAIPHPRIGWVGVIDERVNLDLLASVARRRPDWSFVMIGPTAKIDADAVPSLPNLFWLGAKQYDDLPAFLAGWDVAMMPFALNDATRYISPTKTLEYLAAGRPVVSTSVADVVTPYGHLGLVRIADDPDAFIAAIEAALAEPAATRLPAVDAVLAGRSWDQTFTSMWALVEQAIEDEGPRATSPGAWLATLPRG